MYKTFDTSNTIFDHINGTHYMVTQEELHVFGIALYETLISTRRCDWHENKLTISRYELDKNK